MSYSGRDLNFIVVQVAVGSRELGLSMGLCIEITMFFFKSNCEYILTPLVHSKFSTRGSDISVTIIQYGLSFEAGDTFLGVYSLKILFSLKKNLSHGKIVSWVLGSL